MDRKKELLLTSAARLYSIGVDLEAARERLKTLAERGISYHSAEMKQAYRDFKTLEQQWNELEAQHRELRDEILRSGQQN